MGSSGEHFRAEEAHRVIENAGYSIRTPVGVEAETFVPTTRQLTDEAFGAKVKEIFGLYSVSPNSLIRRGGEWAPTSPSNPGGR